MRLFCPGHVSGGTLRRTDGGRVSTSYARAIRTQAFPKSARLLTLFPDPMRRPVSAPWMRPHGFHCARRDARVSNTDLGSARFRDSNRCPPWKSANGSWRGHASMGRWRNDPAPRIGRRRSVCNPPVGPAATDISIFWVNTIQEGHCRGVADALQERDNFINSVKHEGCGGVRAEMPESTGKGPRGARGRVHHLGKEGAGQVIRVGRAPLPRRKA